MLLVIYPCDGISTKKGMYGKTFSLEHCYLYGGKGSEYL